MRPFVIPTGVTINITLLQKLRVQCVFTKVITFVTVTRISCCFGIPGRNIYVISCCLPFVVTNDAVKTTIDEVMSKQHLLKYTLLGMGESNKHLIFSLPSTIMLP